MIYSLADILEPCVNSASKNSAACTALFSNASPPAATGVAAPVNTWQAALDMAQYPGNNTAALYGLITATPSFQPTFGATAPNDLSIGVNYAGGFDFGNPGSSFNTLPAWGIAADTNDNIFISGIGNSMLVQLSSIGNFSGTGSLGTTLAGASTRQVAVDLHGNILTVDSGGNIYQYIPGSNATNVITAATLGISTGLQGIAIDNNNNVWYSTGSAAGAQRFGELSYNAGTNTFSPVTLSVDATIAANGVSALTVNANNGAVWGPSQGGGSTNYFFSPYTTAPGLLATGDTTNYAAAIDENADVLITGTQSGANGSSLFKVSHLNPTGTPTTINAPSGGSGLEGAQSLMIDGNGRIFISSSTPGFVVEYDPSLGTSGTFFLTAAGNGFNPSTSDINNAPVGTISANGARTIAIDASGALWTVNGTGAARIVQILGIAAPTVSVLAQGKYGAKP
jgi:hypothetical protein